MIRFCILFLFMIWGQVSISQEIKFGKISKEELKETTDPKNPEAHAAILYSNQKNYYDYRQGEGFVQVIEVHKRIKIYDQEGYEWATEAVRLSNASSSSKEKLYNLKGFTYTLDVDKINKAKLKSDAVFVENNNKYWRTAKFTMPNIKEGCVVEFSYTINSPFISIDDISLQYDIPIRKLDLEVKIPEFFNFKKYINPRATYFPEVKEKVINRKEELKSKSREATGRTPYGAAMKTSFNSHNWEFKENVIEVNLADVPPLEKESYVSNLNTYRTKLIWEYAFFKGEDGSIKNYSTTWDEVTKTIYDNEDFGGQLMYNGYFEDELGKLLSGVTDSNKKIKLIYNYVKSRVKWNNLYGYTTDNGVKKAFKEQTGNVADINLMLVAMLRFAGESANPMLISTKSNDIPLFPSTSAFNYVICAVEIQNDVILLDATHEFAMPNILPVRAINWQGRIIRESGSSTWFNLTPKELSVTSTSLNFKVNEDFSIEGKIRTHHDAFAAKSYRVDKSGLSEDALIRKLEDGRGDIEIKNIEQKNMDNLELPVQCSYDFTLQNGVEVVGDKIFIDPMLFFASDENPFQQEKRKYPIDFTYGFKNKYTINVMLPERYEVDSIPENAVVQFNVSEGEYKYIARKNGKMLQFVISFDLNKPFILADEYENFKNFFQLMVEKENEKVVLKRII